MRSQSACQHFINWRPSSSSQRQTQQEQYEELAKSWLASPDASLDGGQFYALTHSDKPDKVRNNVGTYQLNQRTENIHKLAQAALELGLVSPERAALALHLVSPEHHISDISVMDMDTMPDVPVETVEELKREMYVAACEAGSTMGVDPKKLVIAEDTLEKLKDDAARIRELKALIERLKSINVKSSAANVQRAKESRKRKPAKDDARACPTIPPLDTTKDVLFPLPCLEIPKYENGKTLPKGHRYASPQEVFTWQVMWVKACAEAEDCMNAISVRRLNEAWKSAHRWTPELHYDDRYLGVDPRNNGRLMGGIRGLRTPQHFSPDDVAKEAKRQWPGIVDDKAIARIKSVKMERAVKKVTDRRKASTTSVLAGFVEGDAAALAACGPGAGAEGPAGAAVALAPGTAGGPSAPPAPRDSDAVDGGGACASLGGASVGGAGAAALASSAADAVGGGAAQPPLPLHSTPTDRPASLDGAAAADAVDGGGAERAADAVDGGGAERACASLASESVGGELATPPGRPAAAGGGAKKRKNRNGGGGGAAGGGSSSEMNPAAPTGQQRQRRPAGAATAKEARTRKQEPPPPPAMIAGGPPAPPPTGGGGGAAGGGRTMTTTAAKKREANENTPSDKITTNPGAEPSPPQGGGCGGGGVVATKGCAAGMGEGSSAGGGSADSRQRTWAELNLATFNPLNGPTKQRRRVSAALPSLEPAQGPNSILSYCPSFQNKQSKGKGGDVGGPGPGTD